MSPFSVLPVLSMINFPIYELREYISIQEEQGFITIWTSRNRYVLDIDLGPDRSYAQRRLLLLSYGQLLPYTLYPLNKRIETYSQLIKSNRRKFIDNMGKVKTWRPTTYYPVVCLKVDASWTTSIGKTCLQAGPHKFIVSTGATKYIQVVLISDKTTALLDTCNEFRKPTRKKL